MKKLIFTLFLFSLVLSACAPTEATEVIVYEQIVVTATPTSEATVEVIDQSVIPAATEAPAGESATSETPCLICDFDYSSYTGALSETEIHGLLLALNDEYRAWAIYDQVLIDFGIDTRPFSNIISSEAQHIDKLISLFLVYEITVPENLWIGNAPSFDSVPDACAAGVGAEIENVALYDELYTSTERDDIITVYDALQRASLEKHLPAFERCGGNN